MFTLPRIRRIRPIGQIGLISLILFVFPASTNYRLNEWSIGGSGSDRSQSANYQTQAITDPTAGEPTKSTNYMVNPGLLFVEMANVPPAPTVTNPANYYNRLQLVLNTGNNPSNTTYAVAVSTDNFATVSYVKADNTIGPTLTASDWRTYASFGSGTGILILGLQPNTTYQVRVKAERGDFTESGWGPAASAATSPASLSFDIDVATTDQETASPYAVSFGQLPTGSVTTATNKVWIDVATNAVNGVVVYVAGANGGLRSSAKNYIIPSRSADLAGQTEGFGLRNASVTQTSGGPLTADSPFNGAGNVVGSPGTTLTPLNTSLTPITGGRSSHDVKAIISALTPAGADYTETLTLVAAGTF